MAVVLVLVMSWAERRVTCGFTRRFVKSSVLVNTLAEGGIGCRRERCAIGYAGTGDGFILRSGESGEAGQAANTALSQRVVRGESCGRREEVGGDCFVSPD